MTNTQLELFQSTCLLAAAITLVAPYCLALLPPARCKGGSRAHSSPAARLGGEIPPFLALFPGWGRCSRTLARGTTSLAAGGGPGWDRTLSRCPWAGWRGRTGRAAPAASGQSKPGPLRTAPHRAGAGPGLCAAAGRAGKRGGAASGRGPGGWREMPSAGAGGATHAGGGLAARCSPAPRSLKAPFSRSAGSSPEEAGAT